MAVDPTRVRILVVWIDMLTADGRPAAQAAATIFEPFPEVVQFHDPNRLAGAAVASALGAPGRIAWDMYLFYGPEARFEAEIPPPADWAHQLRRTEWAGSSRFHWGQDLPGALRAKMEALLGEGGSASRP